MFSHTLAFVLAIAATFATPAFGQTPPPPTPASSQVAASSPDQTKDLPELVAAKEQIRQLQTQVQVMKDYHGSLLDTVYWALGGVFVVVSLILGFGWFANFKVYERDKQTLREELDAQVKAQNVNLTGSFERLSTELKESISSQVSHAAAALQEQVTSETAKRIDPVSSSVAGVAGRVFRLELTRLKDKMLANPSDNMALTDALGVLELCKTRAQDELPDTINFMLKKIAKGGRLTASEITRVNAVIDELPAHYKALCDRLRAVLVASDIF